MPYAITRPVHSPVSHYPIPSSTPSPLVPSRASIAVSYRRCRKATAAGLQSLMSVLSLFSLAVPRALTNLRGELLAEETSHYDGFGAVSVWKIAVFVVDVTCDALRRGVGSSVRRSFAALDAWRSEARDSPTRRFARRESRSLLMFTAAL